MTTEEFVARCLLLGGEIDVAYAYQARKLCFNNDRLYIYIGYDGKVTVYNVTPDTWSWDMDPIMALEFIQERL